MFLHAFLPLHKGCLMPGIRVSRFVSFKSCLYFKTQANVYSFIHSFTPSFILSTY